MNKPILPKIEIASPCTAGWEDMAGDERSRFCAHCSKRVYNFSKMQPEEISQFILESEGRACVRFYQRRDGTMLLENCPVGADKLMRKVKFGTCSAIALFMLGIGTLFANVKPESRTAAANRVEEMWDDAISEVKGWLGMQPPLIMGKMCTPIPATKSKSLTEKAD